jgi:hypothetical protein
MLEDYIILKTGKMDLFLQTLEDSRFSHYDSLIKNLMQKNIAIKLG